MMDVLNWCAEHPLLSFFLFVGVANGIGKIGSTRNETKVRIKHVHPAED